MHFSITLTGLAYILSFFSLGLFTTRFYSHWRREKNVISMFFFLGFCGFTFFSLIHMIAGLFFSDNTQALMNALSVSAFFRGFGLTCWSYMIFYMFRSKINPMIGVAIVAVISLIAGYLVITAPYEPPSGPYLQSNGSINWGTQPSIDLFGYGLYMAILIPLVVIFVKQIKSADYFVRSRAFGFLVIFGSGMLIVFFSYFVQGPNSTDVAVIVNGIIIIVFYLATRKNMPMDDRLR